MNILIRNTLRGVRKRLFQYFGIAILLIVVIASITSLYANTERVSSAYYKVADNSGTYDYRIAPKAISGYKDGEEALTEIKVAIINQFLWVKDQNERQIIIDQIDDLKQTDIQNNLFPTISGPDPLNEKLRLYLLNWGVDYKSILINDILNNQVKNDSVTANYNFIKSYFKYFNYQNKTAQRFFSFEDGFYLHPQPDGFVPSPGANAFDFNPTRTVSNKVWIVKGRAPTSINEVVINPTFAETNNISLNGDFTYLPDQDLKVVGFGYTYWGITGERTIDNLNPAQKNTTQVFTTREWLNDYLKNNTNQISMLFNQVLLKVTNNDSFFANKLEAIYNKTFNFDYGLLVNYSGNDLRSGALKETFSMQTIIFSSISVIVLMVAIFIVLSYVKKEINIQKKQIGLIKALGYSNTQISIGFTVLIFFITLLAAIAGFALGLPLQLLFNNLGKFQYFLPISSLYLSVFTMVISIVVVPIIFIIASYWQSIFSLRISPLVLIYDKTSSVSSKWLSILKRPFTHWNFKPRLAISFALKSFGKLTLIFFIFVFVSFLLLFQSIATDIFNNKIGSLYGYYNKDVFSNTPSISMYKTTNTGMQKQIFNWKYSKDLDTSKEITSDTFHIDSIIKLLKLNSIITGDLKDYYMPSYELNLLYRNTQPDGIPPGNPAGKCYKYIWPNGPIGTVTEQQAEQLAAGVTNFFHYLASYSGIDPSKGELPGISIGQNIINKNFFPNLQYSGNAPPEWIGHNQGNLGAKWISVTTLYNDPTRGINWKEWFNLTEDKNRDIDNILNRAHNLTRQTVTYIDNFGVKKTVNDCYVVPTAISKTLATLNNYKFGDQFLSLFNVDGNFVPIIFDIQGIIISNLDTSVAYSNINDIRSAIGYQPNSDTFNNAYSKEESILPLNYINIAQPDGEYTLAKLQNTFILINKQPFIYSLIRNALVDVFNGLSAIINITKYLVIFALIFILTIIINMILDNNIMIIAMMKSLGYRINEINLLIIGSYIVALVLAFAIGSIFSYIVWQGIVYLVGKLASTVFIVPINPTTILITFAIISGVMIVAYIVGLYLIKYRSVTSLLQGD